MFFCEFSPHISFSVIFFFFNLQIASSVCLFFHTTIVIETHIKIKYIYIYIYIYIYLFISSSSTYVMES